MHFTSAFLSFPRMGSISSTFYEQLLHAKIPKAKKSLTTWLSFLRFWVESWWNWHMETKTEKKSKKRKNLSWLKTLTDRRQNKYCKKAKVGNGNCEVKKSFSYLFLNLSPTHFLSLQLEIGIVRKSYFINSKLNLSSEAVSA